MCTCTDIIEAICSSIIIPFRYECLQNIQAESDVCLASETPCLYTETHVHRICSTKTHTNANNNRNYLNHALQLYSRAHAVSSPSCVVLQSILCSTFDMCVTILCSAAVHLV